MIVKNVLLCIVMLVVLIGCGGGTKVYKINTKPYTVAGQTYYPLESAKGFSETGVASWYITIVLEWCTSIMKLKKERQKIRHIGIKSG